MAGPAVAPGTTFQTHAVLPCRVEGAPPQCVETARHFKARAAMTARNFRLSTAAKPSGLSSFFVYLRFGLWSSSGIEVRLERVGDGSRQTRSERGRRIYFSCHSVRNGSVTLTSLDATETEALDFCGDCDCTRPGKSLSHPHCPFSTSRPLTSPFFS